MKNIKENHEADWVGWVGPVLSRCEYCDRALDGVFIDARTAFSWMILCPICHNKYGYGLGTGNGQKYQYDSTSKLWPKIGG